MKQVTAAIIIENGKILIARRPLHDALANKWEFPGGKIEYGETPEECLKRELMEEFGIKARIGEYFCNSIYYYEQGEIELLAYFVQWEAGELTPFAHEAIKWVLPEELKEQDFAPADIPIVERLMRGAYK